MVTYRRFITGKLVECADRERGPAADRPRGLLHYRGYVAAYLEAKRAVLAGRESVDA